MAAQGVLVQMIDGRLVATLIPDSADLVAHMEARGFRFKGETQNRRLRPELQGAPTFDGLCGPCWGGDDSPLRYEDWAAYERISK